MRMMVGLTPADRRARPPSSESPTAQLNNPGRQVGVLLDASAQHAGRTGREVLTLGAMVMGLPRSRVDEMLELVGLTDTEAKRRVGNYSLGMRQRLGHRPCPAGRPGGADPRRAGQRPRPGRHPLDAGTAARLRPARRHRAAVLAPACTRSSVIADELVVIGRGKIVAQGSKDDDARAERHDRPALGRRRARQGVGSTRACRSPRRRTGALLVDAEAVAVGSAALAGQVVLLELRPAGGSGLEEMFLQLTADDARTCCPSPRPPTRRCPHEHPDRHCTASGAEADPRRAVPGSSGRAAQAYDTRAGKWLLITIGLLTAGRDRDLPDLRRRPPT